MFTLAHTGHWLVNLIYAAPVMIVVGWLGVQSIRDRRRAKREGGAQSTKEQP